MKKTEKTLKEIKQIVGMPAKVATLAFLIKNNEVLLAMKKRGFGEGRWNGSGGKVHGGETVEEAAKREVKEEIGVSIKNLNKAATLNFYFAKKPEWNQQVIVYSVEDWNGEPAESEEMKPRWFKINEIPYNQMWSGDSYWIPQVLSGKKVEADFLFDDNQQMIDKNVRNVRHI